MFKNPDISSIERKLEAAIRNDTPAKQVFYEFLNGGSLEANFMYGQIINNKRIVRLITSPQGRAWIKKHMDGFLNYLALLAQEG